MELLTREKGGLPIGGFVGMVRGFGQRRPLQSKKVFTGTMLHIASKAGSSSISEECSGVGERTNCEIEEII